MTATQFTGYGATLVLNDVAEPTVGEGDIPVLQGSTVAGSDSPSRCGALL
jgi:hypothetical protein